MTIKTILVAAASAEASKGAVPTAFGVAALFDAHVEVLHIRADPRSTVPYLSEGMSGSMIEEVMQLAENEANERALKARELFDNFCKEKNIPLVEAPPAPQSVSAIWREEIGREDEILVERSRLADLIVIGQPLKEDAEPSSIAFEATLFSSGRPVLVAPPGGRGKFGTNILVAWNGRGEATRAAAAAIPFLRKADSVTLVTVEEGAGANADSADLATYMGWHGIAATQKRVPAGDVTVGEAIMTAAKQQGADLVVMGGYSHSRLREMILGGVTRHVLSHAEIPVLMAH